MTAGVLAAPMVTARDRSQAAVRAAGAGLVNSINKWETLPLLIDKLVARCTRLRKNLGIAAKLHSTDAARCSWFITLTYRSGVPWEPRHISDCLQHLRKWLKRTYGAVLAYEWVMENKVRKSGAEKGRVREHMHLVLWLPVGVSLDDLKLDARGYWPHGMTNAVRAIAPVNYVMKYASKFDNEGAFPKGARCYGVGGLGDAGRRVRRWVNWPAFVQARASISDCWRPAAGGGWTDAATGEWLPSEFGLAFSTPKHSCVIRLHDHGRPMGDVRGPFSWVRNR